MIDEEKLWEVLDSISEKIKNLESSVHALYVVNQNKDAVVDWSTVEYVFQRLDRCLESGGSLNWSRVGKVIMDAQEKLKDKI